MPRLSRAASVVLAPVNDPESIIITRIAEGLRIPLVISAQPHGATLAQEPELTSRLRRANPTGTHVAIVEIPGLAEEEKLRSLGWNVVIIDHHAYPEVDRRAPKSSLQQFLETFCVQDDELRALGLDPRMVHGIGVVDQGFLWALPAAGFSAEEAVRVRAAYLRLREENDPHFEAAHAAAARAWQTRTILPGNPPIVVLQGEEDVPMREAVSYLIADAFPGGPPWSIVRQANGQISVQDIPAGKAEALLAHHGGYLFGGGVCWGKVPDDAPLPSNEELVAFLRTA